MSININIKYTNTHGNYPTINFKLTLCVAKMNYKEICIFNTVPFVEKRINIYYK